MTDIKSEMDSDLDQSYSLNSNADPKNMQELTTYMSSDSVDTDVPSGDATCTSAIKSKILNGEYKINNKKGRSKVWNIFGKIKKVNDGEEIPNIVVCRVCNNIYSSRSMSNLVKHKCYVNGTVNGSLEDETALSQEVLAETKTKWMNIFTEWSVKNCRPFGIIADAAFKNISEYFIMIGANYGRNIDIQSILPHPTTISVNVNQIYRIYFQEIRNEISSIKSNGFGLTSDLWTDNYLKKTYIAVTIHYINDGQLVSRFLGLRPMEGEKCTNENVNQTVSKILEEFDLKFDDKVIIVTNQDSCMATAFQNHNHIFCINNLLHSIIQKSIEDVNDVAELYRQCKELGEYFKVSGLNSNLLTTLNSFANTRWNTMYYLFISIERNWDEIVRQLQKSDQINRMQNINLNNITALIKILEPFQETFEKLEEETNATIHLVFVYIYRLRKICNSSVGDIGLTKQFKEKLSHYLDSDVLKNLTVYHKIGLFLFPPANKLIQFSEEEKKLTKDECKRIMRLYIQEQPEPEDSSMIQSGLSIHNSELFSDFLLHPGASNTIDSITTEVLAYECLNTIFHDDFNILQWWDGHRNEFPLLYKVSCKILATPASITASEKSFSRARNLISDERSAITSNDHTISEILFLHLNVNENELSKYVHTNS